MCIRSITATGTRGCTRNEYGFVSKPGQIYRGVLRPRTPVDCVDQQGGHEAVVFGTGDDRSSVVLQQLFEPFGAIILPIVNLITFIFALGLLVLIVLLIKKKQLEKG